MGKRKDDELGVGRGEAVDVVHNVGQRLAVDAEHWRPLPAVMPRQELAAISNHWPDVEPARTGHQLPVYVQPLTQRSSFRTNSS